MSKSDSTAAMLAAAHTYRNRGWRVIAVHSVGPDGRTCSCNRGAACTSAGKHPIDAAWQNTPPMSAADIEETWQRYPKANVGLATGTASGVWVLDLDPKDNGVENFGELLATVGQGEFPQTFTVQTGSGGYHYYFTMPEGVEVRNTTGKLARGVDTRGTGGQVVAAPSVSNVGPYIVVRDVEVAPAPAWLLELARKQEQSVEVVTAEDLPKPEELSQAEWDRLTSYAKRAVASELTRLDDLDPRVWEAKGSKPWNITTFEVACSLIEFANSPWNAYSLGQAHADLLVHSPRDDGFTDAEVEKCWASARERVGDKARPVPESRREEEYDLFDNPEVRGQAPLDEGGADGATFSNTSPQRFFTGDRGTELDAVALTEAVMADGPIGWGRDEDFWSYDGGVWRSDRQVVKRRMTDLLDYKYRSGIYPTIKDMVRFRATPVSGDPVGQYINFRNGMLDWAAGDALLEHSPDYRSTIQLPVEYHPDAECPNFERFLAQILHPDYVRLAWEMIGYLMYSGNPQQIAFLFYGGGQNGKGTLIRVIEEILGRENLANESLDQLNKSTFSAVNLYGKIANVAGDIDATYQESTANFKKLTGEDMIGAERKFGDRFSFQNWAVPLFSANEIPGSSDVTEGYLRRWVVLHFHRHISKSERVLGLSDLLSTEVEGIVAKGVTALRALMARREFDLSGEAGKGHEEFAEAIDQIRQWVKHGGPRPAPGHQQPLSEIYFEYTVWANKSNQKPLRLSNFSRRLASIGFPVVEVAGVEYHDGIRVTAEDRTPSSNFF